MPTKCAIIIDPPPVLGNLGIPVPDDRVHWIDHKRLNDVDANLVDGNIFLSAALGWNTSINYIFLCNKIILRSSRLEFQN